MRRSGQPAPPERALLALGLAFVTILIVRTAWISDEAYLTLRSVGHAASGYGVRWNVADRVQVYDHPLWLLVLLGGRLLSGETYFTTLGLSLAASLTALWIVLRRATTDLAVVAGIAAAALSPLFLTFSTSGLESPLVHLLIAAFLAAALSGRSDAVLGGIAGLALLTQWTTLFLVAPVLAPRLLASWLHARRLLALTAGPSLSWFVGAWWYYGTVGSNARVASRGVDLTWREHLDAGWSFFQDTTRFDPLLVAVALIGAYLGFVMRGTSARLALGGILAIVWAVVSGGSAMAGRHLTASFVVGLGLMVRYVGASGPWAGLTALAGVAIFAAITPVATPTSNADYGQDFAPTARTHDPRAADYQATGLLLESRSRRAPSHPDIADARDAMRSGGAILAERVPGMVGFALGAEAHVVDREGHTDPLLARLPAAVGARRAWGADRRLPAGYVESLPDGVPAEPALADLVGELREVTRGSLFPIRRAAALLRLPDRVDVAVASSSYGALEVPLDAVPTGEVLVLREGGVRIRLPAAERVSRVNASLTGTYDYRLDVLDGDTIVATVGSPRVRWGLEAETIRTLTLAPAVTATALDFRCGRGIGRCALSQVTIDR